MSLRLLLDTNILIDLFDRRTPFATDALKLRVANEFGDVELWASAKSFTDVFYVMVRAGATSEAVQEVFSESLSFLHVCSVDEDDIALAAAQKWEDFEDCIVALCAEKVHAQFIITRDKDGFERSKLPALSPQAFFDYLEEEYEIVYDEVELLSDDEDESTD